MYPLEQLLVIIRSISIRKVFTKILYYYDNIKMMNLKIYIIYNITISFLNVMFFSIF